jgi:cellulose synthase/poly-beta-1,6-N-acetylglucosamine synthase-like glycosyltransferase
MFLTFYALAKNNVLNFCPFTEAFEYQMSNNLQKATEHVLGFISVLPGAFSAYRFSAIYSDLPGSDCPLKYYFKSISTPISELGPFEANMFLAEDRVLCFELLAAKDKRWQLHYEKNAKAETDVPPDLWTLIRQRRRWLNGSLFATLYALLHFGRFCRNSRHHFVQKLSVLLLFIYYTLSIIANWFAVANFFILFDCVVIESRALLLQSSTSSSDLSRERHDSSEPAVLSGVHTTLVLIYLFTAAGQFAVALGNKPHQASIFYYSLTLFLGVASYLLIMMLVFAFVKQVTLISVFGLVCLGSWVVIGALNYELLTTLLCVTQYIFLMPAFQLIFSLYSFCNLHDISWGTKGLEDGFSSGSTAATLSLDDRKGAGRREEERLLHKKNLARTAATYTKFRSSMLLCLVLSNVTVVTVYQLLYRRRASDGRMFNNAYLVGVLGMTVGMFVFQFFFATTYVLYKALMQSENYLCGRHRRKSARLNQNAAEELYAAHEAQRQRSSRETETKAWAWSAFRPSHVTRGRRSNALTRQWGAISMASLWLIVTLAYTYFITRLEGVEPDFLPATDFCSAGDFFFKGVLDLKKHTNDYPFNGKFTSYGDTGNTAMNWFYHVFSDKDRKWKNGIQQAAVCKSNRIQWNSTPAVHPHDFTVDFWDRIPDGVASAISHDGKGNISLLPSDAIYYDYLNGGTGGLPEGDCCHFKTVDQGQLCPSKCYNPKRLWSPDAQIPSEPSQRVVAAQFFHFEAELNERVRLDFRYKPNLNRDCDYALTAWDGPSPPDLLDDEVKYCLYTHGVLGRRSPFNISAGVDTMLECIPFSENVLLRTGRSGTNATKDSCPFLSTRHDNTAYTTSPVLQPEYPLNDTNGTWVITDNGTDIPINNTEWILSGCKKDWKPACASGKCPESNYTNCSLRAWVRARYDGNGSCIPGHYNKTYLPWACSNGTGKCTRHVNGSGYLQPPEWTQKCHVDTYTAITRKGNGIPSTKSANATNSVAAGMTRASSEYELNSFHACEMEGTENCSFREGSFQTMSTGRQLSIGMTWSCPADLHKLISYPEKYLPTVEANFTFEQNPAWSNPFMSRDNYMRIFGATLLVVWMGGWVLYFELIRRMPTHLISVNDRSRGMMLPQIPNKPFRVRLYYYIPCLTAFSDAATLGLNYLIPFQSAISESAKETEDVSKVPSWLPSFINIVSGFLVKYEENGPFWVAASLCIIGFCCNIAISISDESTESEDERSADGGGGNEGGYDLGDDSGAEEDGNEADDSMNRDGASPSIVMTLRDLVFSTGSFFILTHLLSALQCECFEEDSCPVFWPTPPIAVLVKGPIGATQKETPNNDNLCLGTHHAVYIFIALTLAVPFYFFAVTVQVEAQRKQSMLFNEPTFLALYYQTKAALAFLSAFITGRSKVWLLPVMLTLNFGLLCVNYIRRPCE